MKKQLKWFIKRKVQGGALYVAVMVSIIIGIILTLFILASKNNQRNLIQFSQSSQLNYNLKSAFEISSSDYFTEERNNKWFKNELNDDSLKIKKLNWGGYLVIAAETKNRHQNLSQCALFGTYLNADTGLIISDHSRPVGMSGKVTFKAKCYLPQAGIKPAYIEGQSYISDGGNAGFIKNSPSKIPELNKKFKEAIYSQQNHMDLVNDSAVGSFPQFIDHSFNKKTIVWEATTANLMNLNCKNNIKIIGKNITLDQSCKLDNVLIVCKKIKFKEGFSGSVHVVASDSIIMEKGSELTYPSSFVLAADNSATNSLKCIIMNEDCKFFGGIVAFSNSANQAGNKVFVKLNAKSEVNGLVYCSDYIHVEGKINGTIMCDKLLIKTPSAVYENHLLGCEINPQEYAHNLSVPMIFEKNSDLINCKNL